MTHCVLPLVVITYLRESERGKGWLPRIAEPVWSHCKVSKERIDVRSIFNKRVFLFIAKKSLELFEGHVLHILTVWEEFLTNLREREGGRENDAYRVFKVFCLLSCLL